MDDIEIRYQGRRVETIAQASKRLGIPVNTLRPTLSRLGVEPIAELDGRTPLLDPTAVDAALASRPGRGRRRAA